MRKFKSFMVVFTLLTLLSQLALVSVRADPDPEATLRVSLPAGTKVGPNPDPWLNEGWLLNITGTSGTFVVRTKKIGCCPSDYTYLIIALNDEAYNNLIILTVDSTEIPKTTFQYGTPTPYDKWTWPDDVYPTWFNDTYTLGTIPLEGYRDVTVSVEFSDPTNVRIHFDAYGRTGCYNKIFWSPNSEDSTVWFHPEALQPPHAEFTYSPPSPQVCETVTFDASCSTPDGGEIVSYKWNFGDCNTTTVCVPTITHRYATHGEFTVTLTVTDSEGKSDSTSDTIRVRAHPHAAFTYSPPCPKVCETITFNASESTPDGGCIISFEWSFGDCSPHKCGITATHHYEEPGDYTVTLNVTDSEGKWDTESKTITVSDLPQPPHADFTWCPPSPQVCELVTFDGSESTPNGGCIISYEWDFGDCSPHEYGVVVTHRYTSFGTYTVTLNVTDSEGLWDVECKTIIVRAHPHANFAYEPTSPYVGETVTFDASSSTPDGGYIISYEWDFGDCSPHEFGKIVTHCYSCGGGYTVTLNVTDSEGKWDIESKTITVSGCLKQFPKAQFAVLIEEEWTWSWKEYPFNISDYCKTFQVEVWVLGPIEGYDVKDLYAYEFWLTFDPNWIELVDHEIKHIHTDDFIILEEVNNTLGVYKQVVTALGPVKGFNGSTPVAVLHFHIKQLPCYPNDYVGELELENTKMSDSCTNAIPHSLHNGYFAIHSKKPKISVQYQCQNKITKWIVGENFTVDIVLTDVVNMRSFYMELEWCECLETSYQDVNVTDFLPPPYEIYEIDVGNTCLTAHIRISNDKPAVNGTGVVMRITFKVKNPWPCSIPEYTRINHEWKVEEYTCQIRIRSGYIDAYCPEYREMQFYDCNGLDVENLDFIFTPIPGDLNLDGHVDIVDLLQIAQNYGSTIEAFDLNHDGIVDLYDVVVVAKNYCRIKP